MLPTGVSTCSVTFGKALGAGGDEAALDAVLTMDRTVIHAATGWSINPADERLAVTAGGDIVFHVAHVDQDGFLDASGQTIKNWYYILTVTKKFSSGKALTITKRFQPLVGQETIDLDLIPDGDPLPEMAAPQAEVNSVNGLTGHVVVGGEGVDIGPVIAAVSGEADRAEAAADLAVDISNIDTPDALVATLVPASSGSATSAALSNAIDGVAKFKVADSGLFVSTAGNNANDGLSPGNAKATVEGAHAALPSGKGKINVAGGAHEVNGLQLTNGLQIEGYGSYTGATALISNGDMFTVPSGTSVVDLAVRDISLVANNGSAFNIEGGLALSVIEDVYIAQYGGGAPAVHAASLVDTKWRVNIEAVNGDANPLFHLVASVNNVDAIACNSFTGRGTHTTGYVFHIEDATGGSYAENNRIFDFNFEQTLAGCAKILSGTGNILDNCIALDFPSHITAPLVYIGKSPLSSKASVGNRINLQRHGGDLGTDPAAYDVQLEGSGRAAQTTLLDCWADTYGFKVDFGGNTATNIGTDLIEGENTAYVQGVTPYGTKFLCENPTNLIGAVDAGAGMTMLHPGNHKLYISDGTVWRDALGNVL